MWLPESSCLSCIRRVANRGSGWRTRNSNCGSTRVGSVSDSGTSHPVTAWFPRESADQGRFAGDRRRLSALDARGRIAAVADTDEQLRRQLAHTAEQHGATVMHVPADGRGAAFAFSVGSWRRCGAPELVVIGLSKDVAHAVVNTYVRRVEAGERFVAGRLYDKFLQGCWVTVEKIAKRYYPEFLGSAVLFYGGNGFPALQMIAATPDATFPWHADAPKGFAEYQPVLTNSGGPESWVPGRDGP